MRRLLTQYGILAAFAILFVGSAIWQPELFLKPENLRNLFNQNAPVGIIAIGMTLVIIAGGIDLSVGSMMALIGVLSMTLMNSQGSVFAGAVAALALGAGLGAVNGVVITTGRVAPFVATLAGLVAYRSAALGLANGGEIRTSVAAFGGLGQGGIPLPIHAANGAALILHWPVLIFLSLAVAFQVLLSRTRFGRYCVAVGANEQAARYSAIATGQVKLWTYILLGACTGLSTLCLSSRMESVSSSQMGLYYELDAIAAVAIGGTRLVGGSGRIWGTVVGVLLLGVINNILVASEIPTYWQGCVKGAIIVLAVLLQRSSPDR